MSIVVHGKYVILFQVLADFAIMAANIDDTLAFVQHAIVFLFNHQALLRLSLSELMTSRIVI